MAISIDPDNLPSFVFLHKNHKYKLKLGFYAAPSNPKIFSKAVKDELNKLKFTYCSDLNGLVMGFGKITSNELIQADARHCINVGITVDVYIFRPPVGSILEAIVNQTSDNHVSCLVHNLFNISIVRPEHQPYDKWSGCKIKKDDIINVKVVSFDLTKKLPHITGNIVDKNDTCYKPKNEQDYSPQCSSTDKSVSDFIKSSKCLKKDSKSPSKNSSSDSESSVELQNTVFPLEKCDDKTNISPILRRTSINNRNNIKSQFSSTPVANTENTISSINKIRNKQKEQLQKHLLKHSAGKLTNQQSKKYKEDDGVGTKFKLDASKQEDTQTDSDKEVLNNSIKMYTSTLSPKKSNICSENENHDNQKQIDNKNVKVQSTISPSTSDSESSNGSKNIKLLVNKKDEKKIVCREIEKTQTNNMTGSNINITNTQSTSSSDDEVYTQLKLDVSKKEVRKPNSLNMHTSTLSPKKSNIRPENEKYDNHKQIDNKNVKVQSTISPSTSDSESSNGSKNIKLLVNKKDQKKIVCREIEKTQTNNMTGSNINITNTQSTSSSDDEVYTQLKLDVSKKEVRKPNSLNMHTSTLSPKKSNIRPENEKYDNHKQIDNKNVKVQSTISPSTSGSESSIGSENIKLLVNKKDQKKLYVEKLKKNQTNNMTRSNINITNTQSTSSSDDDVYAQLKHHILKNEVRKPNSDGELLNNSLKMHTSTLSPKNSNICPENEKYDNQKQIDNKNVKVQSTISPSTSDSESSNGSENIKLLVNKKDQKKLCVEKLKKNQTNNMTRSNINITNTQSTSSSDDEIYAQLKHHILKNEVRKPNSDGELLNNSLKMHTSTLSPKKSNICPENEKYDNQKQIDNKNVKVQSTISPSKSDSESSIGSENIKLLVNKNDQKKIVCREIEKNQTNNMTGSNINITNTQCTSSSDDEIYAQLKHHILKNEVRKPNSDGELLNNSLKMHTSTLSPKKSNICPENEKYDNQKQIDNKNVKVQSTISPSKSDSESSIGSENIKLLVNKKDQKKIVCREIEKNQTNNMTGSNINITNTQCTSSSDDEIYAQLKHHILKNEVRKPNSDGELLNNSLKMHTSTLSPKNSNICIENEKYDNQKQIDNKNFKVQSTISLSTSDSESSIGSENIKLLVNKKDQKKIVCREIEKNQTNNMTGSNINITNTQCTSSSDDEIYAQLKHHILKNEVRKPNSDGELLNNSLKMHTSTSSPKNSNICPENEKYDNQKQIDNKNFKVQSTISLSTSDSESSIGSENIKLLVNKKDQKKIVCREIEKNQTNNMTGSNINITNTQSTSSSDDEIYTQLKHHILKKEVRKPNSDGELLNNSLKMHTSTSSPKNSNICPENEKYDNQKQIDNKNFKVQSTISPSTSDSESSIGSENIKLLVNKKDQKKIVWREIEKNQTNNMTRSNINITNTQSTSSSDDEIYTQLKHHILKKEVRKPHSAGKIINREVKNLCKPSNVYPFKLSTKKKNSFQAYDKDDCKNRIDHKIVKIQSTISPSTSDSESNNSSCEDIKLPVYKKDQNKNVCRLIENNQTNNLTVSNINISNTQSTSSSDDDVYAQLKHHILKKEVRKPNSDGELLNNNKLINNSVKSHTSTLSIKRKSTFPENNEEDDHNPIDNKIAIIQSDLESKSENIKLPVIKKDQKKKVCKEIEKSQTNNLTVSNINISNTQSTSSSDDDVYAQLKHHILKKEVRKPNSDGELLNNNILINNSVKSHTSTLSIKRKSTFPENNEEDDHNPIDNKIAIIQSDLESKSENIKLPVNKKDQKKKVCKEIEKSQTNNFIESKINITNTELRSSSNDDISTKVNLDISKNEVLKPHSVDKIINKEVKNLGKPYLYPFSLSTKNKNTFKVNYKQDCMNQIESKLVKKQSSTDSESSSCSNENIILPVNDIGQNKNAYNDIKNNKALYLTPSSSKLNKSNIKEDLSYMLKTDNCIINDINNSLSNKKTLKKKQKQQSKKCTLIKSPKSMINKDKLINTILKWGTDLDEEVLILDENQSKSSIENLSTFRPTKKKTLQTNDKEDCHKQIDNKIAKKHLTNSLSTSDLESRCSENVILPLKHIDQKKNVYKGIKNSKTNNLTGSKINITNIQYTSSSEDDTHTKLKLDIVKQDDTKSLNTYQSFHEIYSNDGIDSSSYFIQDTSASPSLKLIKSSTKKDSSNMFKTDNCNINNVNNLLANKKKNKKKKSTLLKSPKCNKSLPNSVNITNNKDDLIKTILEVDSSSNSDSTDNDIEFIKKIVKKRKLNKIKNVKVPEITIKNNALEKLNKQSEITNKLKKITKSQNASMIITDELSSENIKTKKRKRSEEITKGLLLDNISNSIQDSSCCNSLTKKKKKVHNIIEKNDPCVTEHNNFDKSLSEVKKKKKTKHKEEVIIDELASKNITTKKNKKSKKIAKDLILDSIANSVQDSSSYNFSKKKNKTSNLNDLMTETNDLSEHKNSDKSLSEVKKKKKKKKKTKHNEDMINITVKDNENQNVLVQEEKCAKAKRKVKSLKIDPNHCDTDITINDKLNDKLLDSNLLHKITKPMKKSKKVYKKS